MTVRGERYHQPLALDSHIQRYRVWGGGCPDPLYARTIRTHPMTSALPAEFHRRVQDRARAAMARLGYDGLLLLDTFNVAYVTGFFHTPSERPLGAYLPLDGDPVLFVPLLEQEHAAETGIRDIRIYFEYPAPVHPVTWMAEEIPVQRLAVDDLPASQYQRVLARKPHAEVTDLVTRLRWVKAPEEIALIEKAAHYADVCVAEARQAAAELVPRGGTELDILRACLGATTTRMREDLGALVDLYKGAVVGTVHSGPRAALPHGRPIPRRPLPGETLIVGIGATVGGYHAESGCTFILGEPTTEQRLCLAAAAACDEAGRAAMRPGASCFEVNIAALDALRAAGLGEFIRHRIGHGMGLQGHEGPWLAPGDDTLLTPGMVFSSEPGIYQPGRAGYRTINSMLVTADGGQRLSHYLDEHGPDDRVIAI